MSATQPTALETISIIADGIDRARDHLECALQFAERLQHDHRVDPVERAAVEQLTAHGRTAALWRDLLAEIEDAGDRLDGAQFDLGVLEERLDQDGVLDPDDDAQDDVDDDSPELRPAAAVIPFPST